MKIQLLLPLLGFVFLTAFSPVVKTFTTSEDFFGNAEKKFLCRAADARMMDWAEGQLATEHATNTPLKEYGQRMLDEQDAFMDDIKALAADKNYILPTALSEKKANGLADLKEEKGKDFDKKFIKMMVIDHKRDVKDFKRALKSKDADVSAFAKKYLPVLKEHLATAQKLKEDNL